MPKSRRPGHTDGESKRICHVSILDNADLAPDGRTSRRRAGLTLVPRGEFSIVIGGLAVAAGAEPEIGALTAAYVLVMAIGGSLLARFA